MSVKCNLPDIESGVEYNHDLFWWVLSESGAKVPRDMTGYEGRLQIRDAGPGSTVLADWGTSPNDLDGELVITGNKVTMRVPATKTRLLSFEEKDYDLIVWPEGDKDSASRLVYGVVTASLTVTELPA